MTDEIYGQLEYTFENEYVRDTDTKELIFSPTPVVATTFDAYVPALNGEAPKTNIRIIPNAISVPTWQVERKPSEEVRFGYIGGNHHALDVRESTINLEGYESYVADVDGYAEIMKAAYKLPTMPPTHYHKLYEFFDVSLVPLTTSEFAKCKSHLKMLEAGFSKCALIVSNTQPYSPYITKENCIAISHPSEWAGAIKRLKENPNQVRSSFLNGLWIGQGLNTSTEQSRRW